MFRRIVTVLDSYSSCFVSLAFFVFPFHLYTRNLLNISDQKVLFSDKVAVVSGG